MRYLLLLVLSTSVLAEGQNLKRSIERLATQIQSDIYYSMASTEQLEEAKELLKQARLLINDEDDGSPFGECFEYAHEKMKETYSDPYALNKAKEACEKVKADKVFILYADAYAETYSGYYAVDKAADLATDRKLESIFAELEFILSKMKLSYSGYYAAEKTHELSNRIRKRSLPCLEKAYESYASTYSPYYAAEKAVEFCAE